MLSMKQKLAWLWQNGERILIILFLATFALNIRKVFLTPYSFLNGTFNEYMTPSFSWADMLMITVIIIYTIKWLNGQVNRPDNAKNTNNVLGYKSNKTSSIARLSLVASHETFLLYIFTAWVSVSILWSSYKPIAIYRVFSILLIILFFIIALRKLKNYSWQKMTILGLLANGLFQSILGMFQFLRDRSLGWRFMGESIVSPDLTGVAKIILAGEKHIRAYGTFPHPNVLAGFLLIPIFILLAEILERSKFEHRLPNKVSQETLLHNFSTISLVVSLGIIFFGFALTFSRSAFLGLIIGLLAILWIKLRTSNGHFKPTSVQSLKAKTFLIPLLILTIFFIGTRNSSFFSLQSLGERNVYKDVAYETISGHPIAGVGLGQFVYAEFQKHPDLESWQYQPVHNIYLLIFSELGAVGLILFLLFLFSIFLKLGNGIDPRLTNYYYYCIIISFLVIAFFDHYFWDIKIGVITFILALSLLKN